MCVCQKRFSLSPIAEPLVVNVITPSGYTSRFHVRRSELVADLKQKISLAKAVSIPDQQLFLYGTELQNKTRTGITDRAIVYLALTQHWQQQTLFFTSCNNPSLTISHLSLRLGLEELLPVGVASSSLRLPHQPLPPHMCHMVHVYDVPYVVWVSFIHYLYSQQLKEGIYSGTSE